MKRRRKLIFDNKMDMLKSYSHGIFWYAAWNSKPPKITTSAGSTSVVTSGTSGRQHRAPGASGSGGLTTQGRS